jgi:hypothetical protein
MQSAFNIQTPCMISRRHIFVFMILAINSDYFPNSIKRLVLLWRCKVFSVRYELDLYILFKLIWGFKTRVEAGSNISTVTLRVVGGDETGKSQIWDSKMWSRVPRDSDPRMTALGRDSSIYKNRPVLSSERAPHKNNGSTCHSMFIVAPYDNLICTPGHLLGLTQNSSCHLSVLSCLSSGNIKSNT